MNFFPDLNGVEKVKNVAFCEQVGGDFYFPHISFLISYS